MICSHCGKEIADDSVFCAYCGKETLPPAEEIPMTEETTVTEEIPATEEMPTPKKRRLPLKWLIAAAVAVVAVGALLLNMGTIVGTLVNTFGSDTDYYRYVELKTAKSGTDTVVDYYALLKDALVGSARKTQGTVRPVVGEEAMELLSEVPSVEWDWLNELTVSFESNYSDDLAMLKLAVAVAEGEPFEAIAFWDRAENALFAGLPSASDTYLQFVGDTEEDDDEWVHPPYFSINVVQERLMREPQFAEDLQKALPSEKELDRLMDRYFAIVLDMVDVSAAENTTLTVGDVEQACTKTTVKISEKQYVDILVAVLSAAKEDKDIAAILADMQVFLQTYPLDKEIDLYAEYTEELDEMLLRVKEEGLRATDATFLTMVVYIDKQHEVIGRHITAQEMDFYHATVQKGNTFATELSSDNTLKLSGNGTRRGDVVSGTFELAVDGTSLMTLSVEDFDTGRAKDGYLNGTFRLEPKKALFERMGVGSDTALVYVSYDPSLELVAKNSKNEREMSVSLYKDESLFVGLVFESKAGKADKVTLPETTVDATDEAALVQWWDAIEGETVEEKLETVGVPTELRELLALFVPALS